MHVNDVAKDLQYEEFFMKGRGIKKHTRIGSSSVIDQVLLGRDTDYSGEDPHKEFMDNFGDHAGLKSSEKEEKPVRQGGYSLSSTMDNIIWGRDFDKSGDGAHETFAKIYTGSAGARTEEHPERPFRKGAYSMSSVMDNVIWGRDFDQSGDDPHKGFTETYSGYAGCAAGGRPDRPFRKPVFSNESVMTHVLTGRVDAGAQLGDPHEKFMEQFGAHAGLKSANKVAKPFRRPVMSMKSGADTLIWGRDVDMSGDNFHQGEHFGTNYADHAGKMRCKGKSLDHAHTGKPDELKRSASAPPPPSGGATEDAGPPNRGASDKRQSREKKTPRPRKDKPSDAGGNFAFKPAQRSNSTGSLTARSNQSAPKSTGRSTSAGTLTSRSKSTTRSKQTASAGSLTARSQQSARAASVTSRPSRGSGAHVATPAPRKAPSCAGSAASTTSRDYGKGCWGPSGGGGTSAAAAAAAAPKAAAPSTSRTASTSRSHRSGSETARSHKSGAETSRSHKSCESGLAAAKGR
mmetsp:Transcript_108777/g.281149  ORF Transcript_108777/g.281149 Transcript_108777/m.281149 type:complete len:517 (+) Transcript_108777:106-1656(+)